jgi:hypothetical protein
MLNANDALIVGIIICIESKEGCHLSRLVENLTSFGEAGTSPDLSDYPIMFKRKIETLDDPFLVLLFKLLLGNYCHLPFEELSVSGSPLSTSRFHPIP